MKPTTSLLTPQAILAKGMNALPEERPAFCRLWHKLPDDDNPAQGLVVWVVGDRHPLSFGTSAIEAALLWEVARFGIRIVSNRNSPRSVQNPTIYAKLSIPGAPDDNITVQRLLGGAEAGEIITRDPAIPNDLRGASNRKQGGPSKDDARALTRKHCGLLAECALSSPANFTVAEYLANLDALFAACDAQNHTSEETDQ